MEGASAHNKQGQAKVPNVPPQKGPRNHPGISDSQLTPSHNSREICLPQTGNDSQSPTTQAGRQHLPNENTQSSKASSNARYMPIQAPRAGKVVSSPETRHSSSGNIKSPSRITRASDQANRTTTRAQTLPLPASQSTGSASRQEQRATQDVPKFYPRGAPLSSANMRFACLYWNNECPPHFLRSPTLSELTLSLDIGEELVWSNGGLNLPNLKRFCITFHYDSSSTTGEKSVVPGVCFIEFKNKFLQEVTATLETLSIRVIDTNNGPLEPLNFLDDEKAFICSALTPNHPNLLEVLEMDFKSLHRLRLECRFVLGETKLGAYAEKFRGLEHFSLVFRPGADVDEKDMNEFIESFGSGKRPTIGLEGENRKIVLGDDLKEPHTNLRGEDYVEWE